MFYKSVGSKTKCIFIIWTKKRQFSEDRRGKILTSGKIIYCGLKTE